MAPSEKVSVIEALAATPSEDALSQLRAIAEGADPAAAVLARNAMRNMTDALAHDPESPDGETADASSAVANKAAPARQASPSDGLGDDMSDRKEAIELIRALGQLRDQGLLTQEEFDEKKRQILDRL